MEYEESELPSLAELRPGALKRVGRYTVLRKLATGGMAAVYLAHVTGEHPFQKFVAVKCPHPHLLKNPAILGMFMNEAKTFIETLKKSVREIRLTVSWQDGKSRRDVSASQIVVILPESVGQTPGAPPPPGTTAAATPGQPGQPGQPGASPVTPIPGSGGRQ